jgi:prepilin-type N-terminal cleavage/methylation domain-containing protein
MPLFPHVSRRGTRARPAFTLIEMLTVIAVIGILVSILVPVVGKARYVAKKDKSSALFKDIEQAFEQYRQSYGRYPIFSELSYTKSISAVNGESDFTFYLNGAGNANPIMRQVLTNDSAYQSTVSGPGAVNYNKQRVQFLNLDDSMVSTQDPGTITNPIIVDGFGNPNIGVVVHIGATRSIDQNAFTLPVPDADGDGSLTPKVVRTLPQNIAIYSLILDTNNDPVNSDWITNWPYDDYDQ